MTHTEAFNEKICGTYRHMGASPRLGTLAFPAGEGMCVNIKEGNTKLVNRFYLTVSEPMKIKLNLVSRMSYQEELEQKQLARSLKKAEMIFRVGRTKEEIEETVKELTSQRQGFTHVNEVKKEILKESRQEVQLYMQRNVKDHIHTISDQVYRKLERSIQDERRRRGL